MLCEKPLGLTAHQVKNLAESAQHNQILIHEAFMIASHPQWHWLRSQINEKEPIDISVQFHYDNQDISIFETVQKQRVALGLILAATRCGS